MKAFCGFPSDLLLANKIEFMTSIFHAFNPGLSTLGAMIWQCSN
jgi:hypothetical protein